MSDAAHPGVSPDCVGSPIIADIRQARLVWAAVASGLFLDVAGTSALATALPTIAESFVVNPVSLKFALTGYMLMVAALVAGSGWIANRFGPKRVILVSMAIFTICLLLSAFAATPLQLIAARMMQGVGGAMIAPVGRALVVATAPRERISNALNWFVFAGVLGPLVGPPLVPFVLHFGTWRWIFIAMVPIALAGMVAIARYVPSIPPTPSTRSRFDLAGFLLVAAAAGSAIALLEAISDPRAAKGLIVGLIVILLVSAAGYLAHLRRVDEPILRLDLLARPELALTLGTSFVYRFHVSALPFLLPLLMQTVLGMPVAAVSTVLIALGLGSLGGRPLMSMMARQWSLRWALIVVGSLGAVTLAVPALFGPGFPFWGIVATMLLGGVLRTGFLFYGMVLAFGDAPRDEVAHISTLNTVSQQFSMSIGVALSGALLSWSSQGGALQSTDFLLPFLLFALCALLASLTLLLLPRRAGEGL